MTVFTIPPVAPARRHHPIARALALAAWLVLSSLAPAAHAGPAEDYITTRDKLAGEIAAAAKSGVGEDALDKRSATAIKRLQGLMTTLVGPVRFTGTTPKPIFMPTTLVPEYMESNEPDGLLFSSEDYATRFFITPEPIFAAWLARQAKEKDAPAVFGQGMAAAMGTEPFYYAVFGPDASFVKFMDLPITPRPGETLNAALGLFTQVGARDEAPNTIVFTRISNGRAVVGSADLKVEIPALPACQKIWQGFEAKSKALVDAAEKSKNDQDPRWDESAKVEEEGAAAFQACFVKEAPSLPFFAAATKRAEDLLDAARGQ